MKKWIALTAIVAATSLQAQVRMPQPSTTQTIAQEFGLGKIELSYSRPGLKGRAAFGDNSLLAPLGQVWRTGANGATTITFTDEVVINQVTIKPGKYGLLSIPGKKEWTLIISKDVNVNQPSLYKQENDVVRVTAPAMSKKDRVETFTMQFANVQYESCELHLMWDKTAVSLPIQTFLKARIAADMEKALAGDKPPYFAAATFYNEWMKDNEKALANITKAIEGNKTAFWLYLAKARIQRDLGDKVGAKTSAEECIKMATEAKNDDYVRMAKDLISKL